jgi:hypothetical protein
MSFEEPVKKGAIRNSHLSRRLILPLPLLGSVATWIFAAPACGQSLALDDVKHDTPGKVIKMGESLHVDVDLTLVNITVTDLLIG